MLVGLIRPPPSNFRVVQSPASVHADFSIINFIGDGDISGWWTVGYLDLQPLFLAIDNLDCTEDEKKKFLEYISTTALSLGIE